MGQKELTKDMLNNLASTCGQASKAKGFWEEGARRNKGEMIALMHSELSELLEAIRSPSRGQQPSDHCPEMSAEAEECADLFIRLADYCYGWNIDLGKAIIEKMAFNESRPPKHNKQF
jgi:NTP pyrophosphatase (non-canonical NTP hydrolase)